MISQGPPYAKRTTLLTWVYRRCDLHTLCGAEEDTTSPLLMNCDAAFVEITGSVGRHQFSLEDIVPPPTPRLLRRLRVRRLNLSSLRERERRGE